jgi:hypothetical protein
VVVLNALARPENQFRIGCVDEALWLDYCAGASDGVPMASPADFESTGNIAHGP